MSILHNVYAQSDNYPIALLFKHNAYNLPEIETSYTIPLEVQGMDRADFLLAELQYNDAGKAPVAHCKEYLAKILPVLAGLGTKYIYCADTAFFKALTGATKGEPNLGYILPCTTDGYEHIKVCLGVNHRSLAYNPNNEPKLHMSLETLASEMAGTNMGLGHDIIHSAAYPVGWQQIHVELLKLINEPVLRCDIEAFSLKHYDAGIGTIGFGRTLNDGIAFACDYEELPGGRNAEGEYGRPVINKRVRDVVKQFLTAYAKRGGKLVWHNASYDLKVIIFTLWMEHHHDVDGLLEGLDVMTKLFECTKLIAYLATNNCVRNELSLKALAHPFAGNWGMGDDIKDIRRIPLPELLEYNVVDCLSTKYVQDKYTPIMIADQQEELYEGLMKDSLRTILQIELTGMPLDPVRVQEVKYELQLICQQQEDIIFNSPWITKLHRRLRRNEMIKANAKLKVKVHPIEHFDNFIFNPGSDNQKRVLLYELMNMDVIDRTKGKQPATGAKTLAKQLARLTDPVDIELVTALMDHAKAIKILETFIPAFEAAIDKGEKGIHWLHGNFNLGGTLSGRLSSSKPNLQNLPSGSLYGKLIKSCFMAPPGWIFWGADFASLEDKINALLTKDGNKLKVYTDGYDSHAYRTYHYWPKVFPDIDPSDPASINLIKKDAQGEEHPLRGKSKGPTFALTFQGTWQTLVKNAGFSPMEAKEIEANYHILYAVSTKWVKDRIAQAAKDGYSTAAFGLRIRTPILAKSIMGHRTTPREAEAEARSLGNAISGQSYGLLNNRACNQLMDEVRVSGHSRDIKACALIHDAIYGVCRNDSKVIEWLNTHIISAMEWQDLPEIAHDEVKLGAELDLFWPSWAKALTIPNGATAGEIETQAKEYAASLEEK